MTIIHQLLESGVSVSFSKIHSVNLLHYCTPFFTEDNSSSVHLDWNTGISVSSVSYWNLSDTEEKNLDFEYLRVLSSLIFLFDQFNFNFIIK